MKGIGLLGVLLLAALQYGCASPAVCGGAGAAGGAYAGHELGHSTAATVGGAAAGGLVGAAACN